MTVSKGSDPLSLTKEQTKYRHPGVTVVSERKMNYQVLIDLKFQKALFKCRAELTPKNFTLDFKMKLCVQT